MTWLTVAKAIEELLYQAWNSNQCPCGAFATAFTVYILNGLAEIGKHFHARKMMLHFLKCFEEKLTFFPRSPRHTKLSKGHIIYIFIAYGETSFMKRTLRDENIFIAGCA